MPWKHTNVNLWKQRYGLDSAAFPTAEFDDLDDRTVARFDELEEEAALFQIGIVFARLTNDLEAEAAEEAAYLEWQAEHRDILQSRAFQRWKRERAAYWHTLEGRRESQEIDAHIDEVIERTERTRKQAEVDSQEMG